MKKNRAVFFLIFGAYHLILLLFTLYVRAKHQDPLALIGLLSWTGMFVVGSAVGLILLLVDFFWAWRANKEANTAEESLRHENNTLKAKLYDLQEQHKPVAQTTQPPVK
jgi:Na+/melibiose symporter-like transporter